MTRINSDISPKNLHRAHLVAEIREITMVPASLRRSLKTREVDSIRKGIPVDFTLNKGHVMFFYDKLGFLIKRFNKLADEMERRGYSPDRNRVVAFDGFDPLWYGDWKSTDKDDGIVMERINHRISEKPHLYTDELV
jgi:deoxyribonuclease (pyrimidine dimer)